MDVITCWVLCLEYETNTVSSAMVISRSERYEKVTEIDCFS